MIEFPAMRGYVVDALAELSDREFQERVWIRREKFHASSEANLDLVIHILYDDCMVLPNPEESIGPILSSEWGAERLRALDVVLGGMIEELGDVADIVYITDPRWDRVCSLAGAALAAMIISPREKQWL